MSGLVTVLTGGIGGAKLVLGLTHAISPESVTAIVNTGDDFVHLGLHVSPDIDTLLYTLSNKANPIQGWGRSDESWNFMAVLRSLGGEDWFQLGDGDLALHVLRTAAIAAGQPLSRITADFAHRWGLAARILPMSDNTIETQVETDEGPLSFQHYFVKRHCEPRVSVIHFTGAEKARPAPGVLEAITATHARAIIIAPSNPFLSIDPILSVPGIRKALAYAPVPVIAVSPLVGGKAVKGPTGKLFSELGIAANARNVAQHYAGLIDGLLIDARDPQDDLDIPYRREDTLMNTLDDRIRVARAALDFADSLAVGTWAALVAFKAPDKRKFRLSGRLDPPGRADLSKRLFAHVVGALREVPRIGPIYVLSPAIPDGWKGEWLKDQGRGLNAELEAARQAISPTHILVIHADLPLVAAEDIEALLDAAEVAGVAIAPDRHGSGTNALAITDDCPIRFCFGEDSFALHCAQAGENCPVIQRMGLAIDIDTPDDLDFASCQGFKCPAL